MAEQVWAAFKGISPGATERDKALGKIYWKITDKKLGWTQSIGFVTLKSLIKQILDNKWRVDKLGIVAHGGQVSGRIALDRELSMKNIYSWKKDFNNLANFCMTAGGRVIFFSCAASAGSNGDRLWCKLSEFMPNCEIVGFSKVLETGSIGTGGVGDFFGTAPGLMWEMGDHERKKVNEWSPIAKWAVNGYIVKPTDNEVLTIQALKIKNRFLNPKKLCGSMNCIGHKRLRERCRYDKTVKSYYRHPRQYGDIMASYRQAKLMHGYKTVTIPSLLGVADECGNLILTGRRNRAYLTGNLCKGTQRKKKRRVKGF